jgi:hypothetical protein
MANAVGTLASAVIIQRALELVFTMRPILGAVSLDLSDERCKFNQPIISRKFTVATVNNFGTGATDRADSDVSVTIDQFKEVHHAFTPQELSGTERNLVEESALPIAIAVGNHMVDAIAALWLEANFGAGAQSTTVAIAGTNYSTLTSLRKSLNGRGVPDRPRFVAANSDAYEKWLNDSTVVAALNNQNNGGAIQSGILPGVAGFEGVYEYPALPNAGNMSAFAGYKDSVVLATRLPRDPREVLQNASFPGNLGVVTEPRTGMSVMVNEWIDAATLKANVRLIWMYGKAVGNSNNGQILKTA